MKKFFIGCLVAVLCVFTACSHEEAVISSAKNENNQAYPGDASRSLSDSSISSSNESVDSSRESSGTIASHSQSSDETVTGLPTHGVTADTVLPGEYFYEAEIKKVVLLQKESKPTDKDSNFVLKSVDNRAEYADLLRAVNSEKWRTLPAGEWAKFNPAIANSKAVLIVYNDGRQLAINLHFKSLDTPCFVAAAEIPVGMEYEDFVRQAAKGDVFDRYIVSESTGKALLDLFIEP